MTAGKIKRVSIPLQTTHHPAAFKSAGNQGGQFRRIDIGTDLASSLPILGKRTLAYSTGLVPPNGTSDRRARAILMISAMLGAINLSRAVSAPTFSREILNRLVIS
jgi:hypothetical protein